MVDHAPAPPHRRRLLRILVALLVVALSGAGVVATRSGLTARAAAHLPWAPAQAPCSTTEISVVAAPEAVATVGEILGRLQGRELPDGSCLSVDVRAEAPARTVDDGAVVSATPPQVWVPDSSLWLGQIQGWPLEPVGSLGTSPVVLAAPMPTLNRLGWRRRTPSWPEALSPKRALVAPTMTDDAPSLLGMLALARSIGPGRSAEQAVAAVVLAGRRLPAVDLAAAADLARTKTKEAAVMLTSQKAVGQLNLDPVTEDLASVHPSGAPAVLDYPVVRVARPAEDPVVSAGADLVATSLTSPDGARTARGAGFGPPAPVAAPTTAQAKAAAAQVASFVARVRLLAQPSRMLILMDTSLSMREEVKPGISRIQLAVKAAIDTGELLPESSAIGLWRFAGRQAQNRPYQEVARVADLGSVEGAVTHSDVLKADLMDTPKRLSPGGTALYDSTLAAVRRVRATYDPKATNAVVVFTDGANDYAPGIDLPTFLRMVTADAKAHPQAPIVLVGIGIGPAADMQALHAMVSSVGGRAYRADSPEAVQNALFDSISRRTARPGQS